MYVQEVTVYVVVAVGLDKRLRALGSHAIPESILKFALSSPSQEDYFAREVRSLGPFHMTS